MNTGIAPLTQRPAWHALKSHHEKIRNIHLRALFADDPTRGERLTVEAVGLFLDYSKHRVTDETLRLLAQLARESGLQARRARPSAIHPPPGCPRPRAKPPPRMPPR